jgi:hypothetical protein
LAPSHFHQIALSTVITHGGTNENKVNGIFIFRASTSTQMIFPWYSETSNWTLFRVIV